MTPRSQSKRESSRRETSWQSVADEYDRLVGEEGHYYHRHLILPKVVDFTVATMTPSSHLLDLGCGQGVLARALPKALPYTGVDLAPHLIAKAKEQSKGRDGRRGRGPEFFVGDYTKPLPLPDHHFSHATCILSLQNTDHIGGALQTAARHLKEGGFLVLVLNHPCFRIPRQSAWGVDERKQTQYRRIDRYMSVLKIPIRMHPGKSKTATTWSLHAPLSAYFGALFEAGFVTCKLEEWVSDKASTGSHAKMEDRARAEFPLFLALFCQRVGT